MTELAVAECHSMETRCGGVSVAWFNLWELSKKYWSCQGCVGECRGGSQSNCGYLFAQGGIAEEVHYCPWEIESPFDKPGCFLHKSSCVCLASKQELWDVSSLMWALYQGLLFFSCLEGSEWVNGFYQKMLKKSPVSAEMAWILQQN